MGTGTVINISVLTTISFGLATIHNIGSGERFSDLKTVVPLRKQNRKKYINLQE